jgi:hypothetical protein
MNLPVRLRDRIFLFTFFPALIGYCAWGAATGELYVPGTRGGRDTYLRGIAAWVFTAAPLLVFLGILVRERVVGEMSDRKRLVLEWTLVLAGVAAMVAGYRMDRHCRAELAASGVPAGSPAPRNCRP